MKNIDEIVEKGKLHIKHGKEKDWEQLCYFICENKGLGELGIEIISDAIETMRLLKETDMSVESVVKEVGGGWSGGISSALIEMIVGNFSDKSEYFVNEWNDIKREKRKSIALDEVIKRNVKKQ